MVTIELATYIRGLVNLANYDPWPCAKVAAIGECRIDSCSPLRPVRAMTTMRSSAFSSGCNPFPTLPYRMSNYS